MNVMILAGGSGTRLWPLSRRSQPKQFLRNFQGESLLRKAVRRALAIADPDRIVVVTNREYEFQVRNHVRDENPMLMKQMVLEPAARNTAPAIALGIRWLVERAGMDLSEPCMVMASDHLIEPTEAFVDTVEAAERLTNKGFLVTFGITPTRPETGYGYIRRGAIPIVKGQPGYPVSAFVEKPDLHTAREYVDAGTYLWNSGMFAFSGTDFVEEMASHLPEIADLFNQGYAAILDGFAGLPAISVDYGIMEKTKRAAVVPASFSWSDVGSWDSFYEVLSKDAESNVVTGDVLPVETRNSLILGNKRLIATVGLDRMLIVETPDAILVARQGDAQKVKTIVEALQAEERREVDEHVTIDRPWGSYTVLDEKPGNKIKRIVVQPGEKLSLQLHHHRSEHWVVTRGTARVTVGEQMLEISENESIFVPRGTRHRLENPGAEPLEIVEVQVGDYVGEDDIVRFDDVYGRLNHEKK